LKVLFICVLAICAYFDTKTKKIPIAALVLLISVSMLNMMVHNIPDLLTFLMCGMVVFVCTMFKKEVGMADIVCIVSVFFMFDAAKAAKTVILACLTAVVFGFVYYKGKVRGEKLPFVPFLLLALLFS